MRGVSVQRRNLKTAPCSNLSLLLRHSNQCQSVLMRATNSDRIDRCRWLHRHEIGQVCTVGSAQAHIQQLRLQQVVSQSGLTTNRSQHQVKTLSSPRTTTTLIRTCRAPPSRRSSLRKVINRRHCSTRRVQKEQPTSSTIDKTRQSLTSRQHLHCIHRKQKVVTEQGSCQGVLQCHPCARQVVPL